MSLQIWWRRIILQAQEASQQRSSAPYAGKPCLLLETARKRWTTGALWGTTLAMALLMGYFVVLAVLRW